MSALPAATHATLIAWRLCDGWEGVLLRGRSGVGKSDLALRAVECGWRLVADDRVRLWRSGARVFGAAPGALRGWCEARGQGMARSPALAFAPVGLVADLVDDDRGLERQPRETTTELEAVGVASISLRARDASAPARLLHGLVAAARFDTRPGAGI